MAKPYRGFVTEYDSIASVSLTCFIWFGAKLEENPTKSYTEIAIELQAYIGVTEDELPVETIKQYFSRVQKQHLEHKKGRKNNKSRHESRLSFKPEEQINKPKKKKNGRI